MLDNLIDGLKKELNIGNLISSKNPGEYEIAFDENNHIILSQYEGGYLLSCKIASCPRQNTEQFFNLLMAGNLYGQATANSILGLDEEGNNLTLSQELDYNISHKEFMEKIEDFLNVADFWRKKTSEFQ